MDHHHSTRVLTVALAGLFVLSRPTAAQKTAPIAPDPAAPVLAMPVPIGMQRGSTLEIVLTGSNLAEPVGLWTDIPGAKIAIPRDAKNGTEAGRLRVRLSVPKESPIGFYGLRLATKRGISNLRLFCVDDLPQLVEAGGNNTRASAQVVPVPCAVVGRIDAEASDYFKVHVKAGQRLTFEVLGHRLGSAVDPQITLYDARSERELRAGHDNDARGLQTDPRLTYLFKDAGDYLVEVRDVQFRGGADYVYRLRIGDFPCATSPLPMALKRGVKAAVRFAGPLVDGVAPVEVTAPADPGVDVVWLAPKGPSGLLGWPVALALSDVDEILEQEPNNEPGKATRVPVPGGVTGRIQERGDVDYFVFKATKGQRLAIEPRTHELYSPAEVYMVVKNAKGAELVRSNAAAPGRVDFTPPDSGDYFLHVEHLHHTYYGGPTETYEVRIAPVVPDFTLSLGIDRYGVPQGGIGIAVVNAARAGYTGPIEVEVVGSPSLSGRALIPAGQTSILLPLSARADAPLGGSSVRIQGKATIAGKAIVRSASVAAVLRPALGNLVHPPLQFAEQVAVGITEKPPFALQFAGAEVLRGGSVAVTVSAVRGPGFTGDIVLAPLGLPANVAAVAKNIAKNTNQIKVELKPAANAALGSFPITFTGKAKHQNRDYLAAATPATLAIVLPFDLKLEPAATTLAPGGKAKLKVTATRKAGYKGPIALAVRNLPANVTAAAATIPMGQTAVEIELKAAANAAPLAKTDVNALGTATAAGNQQNASGNVRVELKKSK